MSTLTNARLFFLFIFMRNKCYGQSIPGGLRDRKSKIQMTQRSNMQEILINEDVYVNETNPTTNYGEAPFFTVGRLNRQRYDAFLSVPDLSEEGFVQNLQLCLYKLRGDTDKFLSVRIMRDEWEEGILTWNITQENSFVGNEVVWYGLITIDDGEFQCLNIDDRFIDDIGSATGVSLYYDDVVDSTITFSSSEGCFGFGLSVSSCPYWKYSMTPTKASVPSIASVAPNETDDNESSGKCFLAPFINCDLIRLLFRP